MSPNLVIENVPIGSIRGYERNARTHSEAQIDAIAASIKTFGWTVPILIDQTDTILAGHGRYAAALKLALAEVPIIRVGHLSASQKRAFIIADNKIHDGSKWDGPMLIAELKELKGLGLDLSTTGFDAPSIEDLLATIPNADRPGNNKVIKCPYCGTVHEDSTP